MRLPFLLSGAVACACGGFGVAASDGTGDAAPSLADAGPRDETSGTPDGQADSSATYCTHGKGSRSLCDEFNRQTDDFATAGWKDEVQSASTLHVSGNALEAIVPDLSGPAQDSSDRWARLVADYPVTAQRALVRVRLQVSAATVPESAEPISLVHAWRTTTTDGKLCAVHLRITDLGLVLALEPGSRARPLDQPVQGLRANAWSIVELDVEIGSTLTATARVDGGTKTEVSTAADCASGPAPQARIGISSANDWTIKPSLTARYDFAELIVDPSGL